jgi:hypothetical protein
MNERGLRAAIVVVGVVQIALGVWQVLSPGSFFDSIGGFGPRNDHYMRDVGTFYLALGAVVLLSAQRPAWRAPVLFLTVLQNALHLINHLFDVTRAEPGWVGPVDALSLALVGVLFGWMLGQATGGPGRRAAAVRRGRR